MLGAIAGDVIGSTFEFFATKRKDFELFPEGSRPTDDSILTLAVARWLLDRVDLASTFKAAVRDHPSAGWGGMFHRWALGESTDPYNSFGNGAAMRVSPVGFAFASLDETLAAAEQTAAVTHNHPEGIKGAQATAAAIFLARHGASQHDIRAAITDRFGYNLTRTIDDVRESAVFDETCQISVPEAITAFLDATDFEDAIRNAVSLGADADTQACIAGAIAEAFFGIPDSIREAALARLDQDSRDTIVRFYDRVNAGP